MSHLTAPVVSSHYLLLNPAAREPAPGALSILLLTCLPVIAFQALLNEGGIVPLAKAKFFQASIQRGLIREGLRLPSEMLGSEGPCGPGGMATSLSVPVADHEGSVDGALRSNRLHLMLEGSFVLYAPLSVACPLVEWHYSSQSPQPPSV
jgi:hypothetical protein